MSGYKIELGFTNVQKALTALEVMAFKPLQEDRGNIDATIQRFEFTIELFWKLLKHILEHKGLNVEYPKEVLKESYKGHLIDDEAVWLDMLKDRNLTSHTYDEKLADAIYQRIKMYVPIFKATLVKLQKVWEQE